MPIVKHCTKLGCDTLTMGPLCIEHEQQLEREFVRGRPFTRSAVETRRMAPATIAYASSFRRGSERPAVARPHR